MEAMSEHDDQSRRISSGQLPGYGLYWQVDTVHSWMLALSL